MESQGECEKKRERVREIITLRTWKLKQILNEKERKKGRNYTQVS